MGSEARDTKGHFVSDEKGLICRGCGLSLKELLIQKRDYGSYMSCEEAQKCGQAMAERAGYTIRWSPVEYEPSLRSRYKREKRKQEERSYYEQ